MSMTRFRPARQLFFVIGAVLVLALGSCAAPSPEPSAGPPPETRVETVIDTFHGVDVPDGVRH